jgi:HPt (histidine-containing phosphotransfer) domain-containing protein
MEDRALQLEIIDLFMDQLAGARKKLGAARFNVDEAKYLGHTLRGAALSIGADEIAAIAAGWDELAFEQAELRDLLEKAQIRFKTAVGEFFHQS